MAKVFNINRLFNEIQNPKTPKPQNPKTPAKNHELNSDSPVYLRVVKYEYTNDI
jgi:hypothetical protein